MKPAAIYVRVSSKGQEDNYSLETQEAACRTYAAERSYRVDDARIYREVHTAAELWERPQLTALRAALRGGEFSAVICFAVDRLSREQAHLYILDDEAEWAGAELLFVTEEFEKTPVGKMIRSVKGFAAELEREKIRERSMRGHEAKLRAGKLVGNTPVPYGYKYNDTKTALLHDDVTAPIARRIFAECVGGASLRSIALHLTDEGIPTPRGLPLWTPTSVKIILNNPAYTGNFAARRWRTTRQKGKAVTERRPESDHIPMPEGICPPLIDRATYVATQAKLARNRTEATRNARNPERFLLRAGFARCACCGRALVAQIDPRDYAYYTVNLQQRAINHPAGKFTISAAKLDGDIWELVSLILSDRSIIEREITGLADAAPESGKVESLDRALASLTRKQGNVAAGMALLDDDEARAPLAMQLQLLSEQKKALQAERDATIAQRTNSMALRERLDGLAAMGQAFAAQARTMAYSEKRDWLAALNVAVEVFPKSHDPRYNVSLGIPLPDGSEHRIAFSSTST
jgi:site-specific DNA recombinase